MAGIERSAPLYQRLGARLPFSREDLRVLAGLYGVVGGLHVVGWGLYLHYAAHFPALLGLGFVAYMFGLRHAFDADHIAAVDDSVRYLLRSGRQPLGVGLYFSLGHSTIVMGLAVGLALAAGLVTHAMPHLKELGALIGAAVAGTFLWVIGLLNLWVLLDILKVWQRQRPGGHSHPSLDSLLERRGLLQRLIGTRVRSWLRHSWQMYPLGLLFGLGFDTASEVGLLAMTAGASAGDLPVPAVLCLPILFAAGMTLMDTTDGVLMCKAYNWALINPLRKIFYNITTTGLSVAVALLVGTVELLQVLIGVLGLKGGFWDVMAALDFGRLGYLIVGLFVLAWGLSVAVWRFGRLAEYEALAADAHAAFRLRPAGVLQRSRTPELADDATP